MTPYRDGENLIKRALRAAFNLTLTKVAMNGGIEQNQPVLVDSGNGFLRCDAKVGGSILAHDVIWGWQCQGQL
jgi:hypothetical protein